MNSPTVVKLRNPVRPYAWGSRTAIARLQGRPAPTATPEAELWIGAHPGAPSQVIEPPAVNAGPDGAAAEPDLGAWIAAHREPVLGCGGLDELPFLVKLLAAARPLSIQLHPDARQARLGFAREEAAGIARDAADRAYRDPHPKIEVLCALEPFELLYGFRTDGRVREVIAATGARWLHDSLRGTPTPGELAAVLFERVLALPAPDAERFVTALRAWVGTAAPGDPDADRVARALQVHPGDPTAVAPLLMNPVRLQPGEAIVIPPGTPHTYLQGFGLEVMTPSDNVVRCGLTPKPVNLEEFGRLLARQAVSPQTVSAPSAGGIGRPVEYPLDVDVFGLAVQRLPAGKRTVTTHWAAGRVRVATCVAGSVTLGEPGAAGVGVSAGEAALVPARVDTVAVRATGQREEACLYWVRSARPPLTR